MGTAHLPSPGGERYFVEKERARKIKKRES